MGGFSAGSFAIAAFSIAAYSFDLPPAGGSQISSGSAGGISWTRSTRRSDTAVLSVARPPAGWPFEEQDEEKVVVELMRIAYTEYFT